MRIRVVDVAWPNKDDIDPDRHLDVQVLDKHVKQCALKTPPLGYSREQEKLDLRRDEIHAQHHQELDRERNEVS